MKLLVFSDSHRSLSAMRRIIAREQPDEVIHLGDYIGDAEQIEREFPSIGFLKVVGNCDYGRREPAILQPTRGGVKLFLTHGHLQHVKYSYQRLEYAAMEAEAQVALFGHTHVPYLAQVQGIWMMNPGAAGMGNYGVVRIENGQAECQLKQEDEQ